MAQHRVAYTDVGRGPTLLLCHAGQWQFLWRDLIGQLRSSFRCVAFDPWGSGLSDRVPANLRTLTAVRDATGHLIDHLDLRGIALVLHDRGGVAALAAAATRLDQLDAPPCVCVRARLPNRDDRGHCPMASGQSLTRLLITTTTR